MRLYNKHKQRRWAMLVAAKHQHPKPAQSRAYPSTAHSFLQMHLSSQEAEAPVSAVLHPSNAACDGAPWEQRQHLQLSRALAHRAGAGPAHCAGNAQHCNPPVDNRELTAMLCWELGWDHWLTWPVQVWWAAGLFFVLFRSNYDARHKLEMKTREVFCIWRQSYIPFTNKTFFLKKSLFKYC